MSQYCSDELMARLKGSLPIIYSEDVERAVSVHSAGILEALEDIYKADRIVREIRAGKILQ
jgi:hypothetical protein